MKSDDDDDGGSYAGEEEDLWSQQEFHNTVRENIIFLLFFLTLTCVSSCVIEWMSSSPPPPQERRGRRNNGLEKSSSSSSSPVNSRTELGSAGIKNSSRTQQQNSHRDHGDGDDDDESVVKRICSWLCTLTLSTSISATLLLPISIVSNEVLLIYPTNKYLEWLNGMLIQGLWSLVFLFSNIGLFVLLPFAHLFIEAEGFSGKKRGLISKLHEALVILILLTFTVWGIAVIVNSFVLTRGSNVLFHFNQLPFIYSCISFSGVLVLTVCTPLGLSTLFTLLSDNFVFVPEFLRNLENEHVCAVLECENLRNHREGIVRKEQAAVSRHGDCYDGGVVLRGKYGNEESLIEIDERIERLEGVISRLDGLRTTPPWKRNVLYPGLFLSVLFVTGLTVFIVVINAFKIVVGLRDLSIEVVAKETLPLGRSSLSFLGPSGAIFEIILVMYLITTCLIGLYNLPVFRSVTPVRGGTPTSHLIFNSGILLVLSSALPVFMRILGLTNFDLLGTYAGKIDWIENTLIVVSVNLLFSVLTIVCLINKVTRRISHEIIRRLRMIVVGVKQG